VDSEAKQAGCHIDTPAENRMTVAFFCIGLDRDSRIRGRPERTGSPPDRSWQAAFSGVSFELTSLLRA
jgi:hypothetical protein